MGFLDSILGGSESSSSSASGLSANPQWLQDIFKDTAVPATLDAYNALNNQSMSRVAAPTQGNIFGSDQLYGLQLAQDMRNGLIPQQDIYTQNGVTTLNPTQTQSMPTQGAAQPAAQGSSGGMSADLMKAYALMGGAATGMGGQKMNQLASNRMNDSEYMNQAAKLLGQQPGWTAEQILALDGSKLNALLGQA